MARPSDVVKGSKVLVLASVCIVLAALYFAREVMIPLALAVLFCFLLAPITTRLQRLGLGRVTAVMAVVLAAFLLAASLGWIVTVQVLNLVDRLPDYQDNIANKVRLVRGQGGTFEKVGQVIENVDKASTQPAATQPATTRSATQPADGEGRVAEAVEEVASNPVGVIARAAADLPPPPPASPEVPATQPGADPQHPIFVVDAETASPLETLGAYSGLVLAPLGTAGLVVVFVIFMLIQREDLRDRMIRLLGKGRLHVTTQAVNDAAERISRYMIAQAIVNGSYGVAITLGLWLIGKFAGDKPFPTFVLWGVLCAVLRFIPYVGPWIAATFPIVLSLAVYDGFTVFFWTAGMFVVIELLSNNLMEPWLYGTSTGMSTVAVLVSAVFWTWLWGPVGLLLATPLTVCLVVLGKYVPQLQFLDILLGDEPVLEPSQRVYQRLLAFDQEEATELGHELLKTLTLEQVYDDVLMPALALAETDRHKGRLNEERVTFIRQAMRDMVEELADAGKAMEHRAETEALKRQAADTVKAAKTGTLPASQALPPGGNGNAAAVAAPATAPTAAAAAGVPSSDGAVARPRGRIPKDCTVTVLCLPAHDEADEIVGAMLSNLLDLRGYCAVNLSVTKLASEMLEAVEEKKADLVCVSALPPAAVTHSRYLCKRLHARYPDIAMVVGLWAARGDLKKATDRITCEQSVSVVTTLEKALEQIQQSAQPLLVKAAAPAARE